MLVMGFAVSAALACFGLHFPIFFPFRFWQMTNGTFEGNFICGEEEEEEEERHPRDKSDRAAAAAADLELQIILRRSQTLTVCISARPRGPETTGDREMPT